MVWPVHRVRGCFSALSALALIAFATPAAATDCNPASGLSPCFESDALRVPAAHARFGGIASPQIVRAGQAAFSLSSSLVLRPLVLNAPSPAAEGREIPVVERELGLIVGVGVGLGHELEFLASMPASTARQGSGIEGVTSQRGEPLARAAVRDPRLGLAWSPLPPRAARALAVETRLEASLPFGDEAWFAGYAGPALLPAVSGELTLGRFVLALELGARLGEAVDFATTTQGSELFIGSGLALSILERGLLDASVELWLRPGLSGQPDNPRYAGVTSGMAAEWLLGLRSSDDDAFSIFAGGGTGLPLAQETIDGASQSVFAPTAPAFRGLLALRYAPER
jgi:hypothetical protein